MSPFSTVAAYILITACVVLSFWHIHKHQYRNSAGAISFAFILFVGIQLCSNGIFKLQNITAEQILCWLFGLALFVLALYFAHKNSLSYAFAIVIMSVFSFFCGLTGVQIFLKSHLLWQLTRSLETYGEKIDTFQTTVIDMRKALSEQQAQLASNQMSLALTVTNVQNDFMQRESDLKLSQSLLSDRQDEFKSEISKVKNGILNNQSSNQFAITTAEYKIEKAQSDIANQFQLLSEISSNASTTLTNLIAQQNILTNVEFLVNRLYSGTVDENFTSSATNKLIILDLPSVKICVFRLDYVPVQNSIQAFAQSVTGTIPLIPSSLQQGGNVVTTRFFGDNNLSTTTFIFRYIKDPHYTNAARTMSQIATNAVMVDGQTLRF